MHTPGPWAWIDPMKRLNSAHGLIFDHAEYEGMWFAAYDKQRDEANARLIAAAPELLDALRTARALLVGHDKPLDPSIDAAIAKATKS